jgi:hypothetical protein
MDIKMELKEYKGKLKTKQAGVGTKSEGPEYYLELIEPNEFGQTELFIRKEGHLWESDPNLHPFIGKNVIIIGEPMITKHVKFEGTIKSEGIDYKEIKGI